MSGIAKGAKAGILTPCGARNVDEQLGIFDTCATELSCKKDAAGDE